MISKEQCLQIETGIVVTCRNKSWVYPNGKCPLDSCEAKKVLNNPTRVREILKEEVGPLAANLLDFKNPLVQRLVFHTVCPSNPVRKK
jgi:hypothetical protein